MGQEGQQGCLLQDKTSACEWDWRDGALAHSPSVWRVLDMLQSTFHKYSQMSWWVQSWYVTPCAHFCIRERNWTGGASHAAYIQNKVDLRPENVLGSVEFEAFSIRSLIQMVIMLDQYIYVAHWKLVTLLPTSVSKEKLAQ